MLKYLLAAVILSVSLPLHAQEQPDFQENGRDIAVRMRTDGKLGYLAELKTVDFVESEQKTIDGQPHRIASYRVRLVVKQPFCMIVRNTLGLSITYDLRTCVNTPVFQTGEKFEPVMQTIWKLTDQGWRLTQQQIVRVFP